MDDEAAGVGEITVRCMANNDFLTVDYMIGKVHSISLAVF